MTEGKADLLLSLQVKLLSRDCDFNSLYSEIRPKCKIVTNFHQMKDIEKKRDLIASNNNIFIISKNWPLKF